MSPAFRSMPLAVAIRAVFLPVRFVRKGRRCGRPHLPVMIACPDGSCPPDPDRSFFCVLFLPRKSFISTPQIDGPHGGSYAGTATVSPKRQPEEGT